jgi:membrane protease YdiL (CAAX protease family)
MCLECLILAAVLVGLARLQSRLWPLDVTAGLTGLATRFVGFCGAGLYEEVLFRLLLLPAVGWTIARLGAAPRAAATWSVFLTSVLFAAAHYIGPLGDTFDLHSFAFRTLAGLFFAALFLTRGFGIAAGTHAVYDMIVGLV